LGRGEGENERGALGTGLDSRGWRKGALTFREGKAFGGFGKRSG